MKEHIADIIGSGGGVIRRQDDPELRFQLDRLRHSGQLISLLPGILCPPELADDWRTRVLAGVRWAGGAGYCAISRDRPWSELELAGYLVLNFTWAQVHDDPEWVVDCIRRALRMQEQCLRTRRIGR